jgi:hypothetical protein
MSRTRGALVALTLTFVGIAPSLGHATLFDIGVVAGLDPGTKELIARLPRDIQDNIVSAIRTTLPMFRTAFKDSLDDIDAAIQTNIERGSCTATGFLQQTTDVVHNIVPELNPFSRPPLYHPGENVRESVNKEIGTLELNTETEKISFEYADMLYNLKVVVCQMSATDPASAKPTLTFISEITPRATTWFGLQNKCLDAVDCVKSRYNAISAMIKSADKRDLAGADANTRFAKLADPGKIPPTGFAATEAQLSEMMAIERAVSLAALYRESLAHDELQKSELSINDKKLNLSKAHVSFDSNQCGNKASVSSTVNGINFASVNASFEQAKSYSQSNEVIAAITEQSADVADIMKDQSSFANIVKSLNCTPDCSKQADAKGLHGSARKKFRAECRNSGGQ